MSDRDWDFEDDVQCKLNQILKEIRQMSTAVANLQAADSGMADSLTKVQQTQKDVVGELESIASELQAHEDPAIQAVADQINQQAQALSASADAMEAAVQAAKQSGGSTQPAGATPVAPAGSANPGAALTGVSGATAVHAAASVGPITGNPFIAGTTPTEPKAPAQPEVVSTQEDNQKASSEQKLAS